MDQKIINQNDCVLCKIGVESVLHVLWSCTMVKKLWKVTGCVDKLKNCLVISFEDLCNVVFTKLTDFDMERFAFIAWSIWNHRNALLHGSFVRPFPSLLDHAFQLHGEFSELMLKMNLGEKKNQAVSMQQGCSPHSTGRLKIYVDAATSSNHMGIGVIVRNHKGEIIRVLAKPISLVLLNSYS